MEERQWQLIDIERKLRYIACMLKNSDSPYHKDVWNCANELNRAMLNLNDSVKKVVG